MSEHISKTVKNSGESNSLWKYFALRSKAIPADEKGGVEGRIEYLTLQVEGIRKMIEEAEMRREDYFRGPLMGRALLKELMDTIEKSGSKLLIAELGDKAIKLIVKAGSLQSVVKDKLMRRAGLNGYLLTIEEQ